MYEVPIELVVGRPVAENPLWYRGKDHCTPFLQFFWLGFDQTIKYLIICMLVNQFQSRWRPAVQRSFPQQWVFFEVGNATAAFYFKRLICFVLVLTAVSAMLIYLFADTRLPPPVLLIFYRRTVFLTFSAVVKGYLFVRQSRIEREKQPRRKQQQKAFSV